MKKRPQQIVESYTMSAIVANRLSYRRLATTARAPVWPIVTQNKKSRKRKHAKRRADKYRNLLRVDPTRTSGLRRSFMAKIRRQFGLLKGAIWKMVAVDDALGLRQRDPNQSIFALNAVDQSTPQDVYWPVNNQSDLRAWETANQFCPTGSLTENRWGIFSGGKKESSSDSGGENCGTGAGGFQPGNTCSGKGKDTPSKVDSSTGAGSGGKVQSGVPAGKAKDVDAKQHPLVKTPEFKKWFSGSKVTDSKGDPKETAAADLREQEGSPIVVYHGTAHGPFEEFRDDKISNPDELYYGRGFYFTEDVGAAKVFAETQHSGASDPTVMSMFLAIRNPFDVDNDTIDPRKLPERDRAQLRAAVVQQAFNEDGRSEAVQAGRDFDAGQRKFSYEQLVKQYGVSKESVRGVLEEMGHDGMTVKSAEVSGQGKNRFWIAFKPTQIKSTMNKGKFDDQDPNILNEGWVDITSNLLVNEEGQVNNPEGCNQYTGPDCSGADGPKTAASEKMSNRVLKAAEGIGFADHSNVVGHENIRRTDYDEIERALTPKQVKDLKEYLDQAKDEYVNTMMEDFSADVDMRELARMLDYSSDDIVERIKEIVQEQVEGDAQTELLDQVNQISSQSTYRKTHSTASIDRFRNGLTDIPLELESALDEYYSEVKDVMDEEEQKEIDSQEDQFRDSIDFDEQDAKQEWLQGLYDDYPEQFSESEKTIDTGIWFRDIEGDDVLRFETGKGDSYFVRGVRSRQHDILGLPATQMMFEDEDESTSVTGRGSAVEVFGKVSAAIVAYFKTKEPALTTFSAAEPSRQKLYDRLTKTIAKVSPEHSVITVSPPGQPRLYAIVKRDIRDQVAKAIMDKAEAQWKRTNPTTPFSESRIKVEVLVNQLYHLDPAWWGDGLVANENPEGCNQHTGPNCSGSTSSEPAPIPPSKLKQLSEKLDKVPGAKRLREKAAKLKAKLVDRYGAKAATAIIASGQALSWGAFGVGAATGTPIWIPSAVATMPAIAVAEIHHQLTKDRNKQPTGNEDNPFDIDLTPEELDRLAAEFWAEMQEGWEEPVDNAEWDENAHPRDEQGRFAGGGGEVQSLKPEELKPALESLRERFAEAAQKEYDSWEQDEDGNDEMLGGGGICDGVRDAIGNIIAESIPGAEIIEGGQEGDDHAYQYVRIGDKAYGVDIPPHVYEEGGGYSWRKIPDVKIDPSDIDIWEVPSKDFDDRVDNLSSADVDRAARDAEPNPTETQREAGNYAKGHVRIQGLNIAIETAAGNKRKPWHSTPLAHHYGYIKHVSDADGDHVDVFIGPDPESELVFVVDQQVDTPYGFCPICGAPGKTRQRCLNGSDYCYNGHKYPSRPQRPGGMRFDEHKCMIGFHSLDEAKAGYLANYEPGWKGFGGITQLTMEQFKRWLKEGDTSKPIAGQKLTTNVFDPDQARDEDGRFTRGGISKETDSRMKKSWTPEMGQFKQFNGFDRSKEQDEAVKAYTFVATSQRVNRAVRGEETPSDETKQIIKDMDAAFAKASLPGDVTTYRGITTTRPLVVGDVLDHPSYMSTSLDPNFAKTHAGKVSSGKDTGAGKVEGEGGLPVTIKLLMPKGSRVLTGAQSALELIADKGGRIRITKITKQHAVGVLEQRERHTSNQFIVNAPPQVWRFESDPAKVRAFQNWLKKQMESYVRGMTQRQLWEAYVQEGFRRGAGRAFEDVTKGKKSTAQTQQQLDFYAGTKDQFLKSSFAAPETVEKVEMLASRSFDELEDVTREMSNKISRELVDGLVEGLNPKQIASNMTKVVDIGRQRAETISRTEIIRVHAEGQLDAMQRLGVTEVGVAVEFATAGDDRVCERCAALEGVVLRIDEARNLIPVHPNCRCAFLPANVGEDEDDQVREKQDINDAFEDAEIDYEVDGYRPESIFNAAGILAPSEYQNPNWTY